MRAYAETAGPPWQETILTCAFASVGDAAITGGVYLVVAVATRDWTWGFKAGLKLYALAVVSGALSAIAIELIALKTGRWSYANEMPKLPIFRTGLWPFLQLTILVPFAIWIGWRRNIRSRRGVK